MRPIVLLLLWIVTGIPFASGVLASSAADGLIALLRSRGGQALVLKVPEANVLARGLTGSELTQAADVELLARRLEGASALAERQQLERAYGALIEEIQLRPRAELSLEETRELARFASTARSWRAASRDFLARGESSSIGEMRAAVEAASGAREIDPRLALELWKANRRHFEKVMEQGIHAYHPDPYMPKDATFRVASIRVVHPHPRYPIYEAEFMVGWSGIERPFRFSFRSNGQAAFLNQSWKLSQMLSPARDFDFVYLGADGSVARADQTQLILEAMPGTDVTLSRGMSHQELELWRAGRFDQIRNRETGTKDPRSYFALNGYDFNSKAILKARVPRELLLELARSGELVINTYEDKAWSHLFGMTEESRTWFGLEVEVVTLGMRARQALLPYMQAAAAGL
jgi:hypothetical protein